jgi:hypothetical protein
MRKVGIPFNPGVAVDPDLTGLSTTFTAEYRLEGTTGAFTPIAGSFTEEYAGFYTIPLTINTPGSYLIKFVSNDTRIGNHEGYVQVANTSLDDIQTAIDNMQADMTSVKAQVDTLDEVELNNLHEELAAMAQTVNTISTMLNDSTDTYFEVAGDQTATIAAGETIVGGTSNATGTVQTVTYDATSDKTKVIVTDTVGTFVNGEAVTCNGDAVTGTIIAATKNVVNSVYEFITQINDTLLSGGSSLDILRSFSLDVKHMLNGDALFEDGSANPTAGKGLVAIFDELVANHADLTALKALAQDATVGFAAIKNAITAGEASIQAKIDTLNDLGNPDSLASRLVTINTIVTNNSSVLTNATYGNAALKDAITALSTGSTGGTDSIITILEDATNGLAAIKTAIMDKLGLMDGKLDTIITTQSAKVTTRVVL